MKEKSQVLKTHSKSENSTHHKTFKEKHRQIASCRDKVESLKCRSVSKNHSDKSSDKHRSSKESNKKKNYRDEITHDESYEELSRKKRKIERELQALDLEEAAAKKQKQEKKTSRHHNLSDRDGLSSDEGNRLAFVRNRQKQEKKTSRHQNLSDRDGLSSDEGNRLAFERNRREIKKKALEKKTSRHQNISVKDERSSEEDNHLVSERNRQRPEKISRYQNVSVKEEPVSDEDRHSASERNRQREERKKDKEKPDFAVSGKLAEDTNVYNGVVIKYNEPSEARKPKRRWRLYPFKGESDLPFIPIHRQSAYLLGRTRAIADIPIDHPSCSKQHAVLQFRLVPYTRDDGTKGRRVRPYIIDLESANGTFVNNNRINPRCYVELMEKDVIKFGFSSREYVLLHEESKNDDYDDVRDSN